VRGSVVRGSVVRCRERQCGAVWCELNGGGVELGSRAEFLSRWTVCVCVHTTIGTSLLTSIGAFVGAMECTLHCLRPFPTYLISSLHPTLTPLLFTPFYSTSHNIKESTRVSRTHQLIARVTMTAAIAVAGQPRGRRRATSRGRRRVCVTRRTSSSSGGHSREI
jgi:hypothetical protein